MADDAPAAEEPVSMEAPNESVATESAAAAGSETNQEVEQETKADSGNVQSEEASLEHQEKAPVTENAVAGMLILF